MQIQKSIHKFYEYLKSLLYNYDYFRKLEAILHLSDIEVMVFCQRFGRFQLITTFMRKSRFKSTLWFGSSNRQPKVFVLQLDVFIYNRIGSTLERMWCIL